MSFPRYFCMNINWDPHNFTYLIPGPIYTVVLQSVKTWKTLKIKSLKPVNFFFFCKLFSVGSSKIFWMHNTGYCQAARPSPPAGKKIHKNRSVVNSSQWISFLWKEKAYVLIFISSLVCVCVCGGGRGGLENFILYFTYMHRARKRILDPSCGGASICVGKFNKRFNNTYLLLDP